MIDPVTIAWLLEQLGISVAGSAVYDAIKNYFATEPHPTREGLSQCLRSQITIEGQEVWADRLIQFLAAQGDIVIIGSEVRAPGLSMAAQDGSTIAVERGSRVRGGGIGIESAPGGRLRIESAPGSRVRVEGGDGFLRFET
jgi:hypothetical protein